MHEIPRTELHRRRVVIPMRSAASAFFSPAVMGARPVTNRTAEASAFPCTDLAATAACSFFICKNEAGGRREQNVAPRCQHSERKLKNVLRCTPKCHRHLIRYESGDGEEP